MLCSNENWRNQGSAQGTLPQRPSSILMTELQMNPQGPSLVYSYCLVTLRYSIGLTHEKQHVKLGRLRGRSTEKHNKWSSGVPEHSGACNTEKSLLP